MLNCFKIIFTFITLLTLPPNVGGYHKLSLKRKASTKLQNGVAPIESSEFLHEPSPATSSYIMQQTMLRVKDPKLSLSWYSEVLGMRLMQELHFQEYKFSLYFMGYCNETDIPTDPAERVRWAFSQPATIELTHNWGTEDDANFKYHNGNDEPRGFGHIGITVPDVYEACNRFETLGVKFRKRPDEGSMKGLAFILDPDDYSVEILQADNMQRKFSPK